MHKDLRSDEMSSAAEYMKTLKILLYTHIHVDSTPFWDIHSFYHISSIIRCSIIHIKALKGRQLEVRLLDFHVIYSGSRPENTMYIELDSHVLQTAEAE